jgi:hypothetical protein
MDGRAGNSLLGNCFAPCLPIFATSTISTIIAILVCIRSTTTTALGNKRAKAGVTAIVALRTTSTSTRPTGTNFHWICLLGCHREGAMN